LSLSFACGPKDVACDASYAYGLNIPVLDSTNDTPLCDAVVRATDGDYAETLMSFPGSPCTFVGAGEREGTYRIESTRDGYVAQVSSATVKKDASNCHVAGEVITVKLLES